MSKIEFPVVVGNKWSYPKEALCPWCMKHKVFEPHSMAILAGGSFLLDKSGASTDSDLRMEGFLSIAWHGAHDGGEGIHKDKSGIVEIAKDVELGQFDLYFCSTECLRSFLNHAVDELERKMGIKITTL